MKKLLFLLTFLFIFASRAHASDFTTSYKINYEVNEDLVTSVSQDLTIRNLSSKIFPTSYSFKIASLKIYDIEALEKGDKLKVETDTNEEGTEVKVFFKNETIGEGKDFTWALKYKTKDLVSKKGSIVDVLIPKFSIPDNASSYTVNLITNQKLGKASSVNPNSYTVSTKGSNTIYTFDQDSLKTSPISATFGDYQLFGFKLSYTLTNDGLFSKKLSIALPPDIANRQQVFFTSINPTPENITIDKDGNYIAYYYIPSKSNLEITVVGKAKVTSPQIDVNKGENKAKIPADINIEYTKLQKYWDTQNEEIKETAKSLARDEQSTIKIAKAIYDFVTTKLTYKNEKSKSQAVERLGGAKALNEPENAICMEFVDLFISLARAVGVPAREINGYAYSNTNNLKPLSINLKGGDSLHAWVEFYEPNYGWIQIDPTWGSTSKQDYFSKLGTNHFAFVIKGLSSESPLPAGSYKTANSTSQVDVSFSEEELQSDSANVKLEAYKNQSVNPIKMLKGLSEINVVNKGTSAVFNINGSKTVLPAQGSIKLFLKEEDNKVKLSFEDFLGEKKEVELKLQPKKSVDEKTATTDIFINGYLVFGALVLILLLCGMFYFLVIVKRFPQKLIFRLFRHPQDQGR